LNDPLQALREPATIRQRCAAITQAVGDERSARWRIDRSRLPAAAERVATLTLQRFPDLQIPLHSRWRHFEAGGVDRKAELDAALAGRSGAEMARARFDLTVLSVLLDAGAGAAWRYRENEPAPEAGAGAGAARSYERSEGLAIASLRAFMAGRFSAHPGDALRVDAAALLALDADTLRAVFQVGASNPLVGLDGRVALLNRLGGALQHEAARDGLEARPALLYDRLLQRGGSVAAADVLGEVLRSLAHAWRSGSIVKGVQAGDIWPHRFAGGATDHGQDTTTAGWVPFHKLSQWLSYSLLEPLQWAGVNVGGVDALTALPEYRNGGLLIDCGVIRPRHERDLARVWSVADEFIIEWRALTVTLIDELALQVRTRLGRGAAELPLGCILEGGTWAAGRQIAAELRDGSPPLRIDSDGTIF